MQYYEHGGSEIECENQLRMLSQQEIVCNSHAINAQTILFFFSLDDSIKVLCYYIVLY